MKNFNWIITIVFCALIATSSEKCFAQRMYISTTDADYKSDTLRMDGYTYICDTLRGAKITLRNIDNHPGRGEVRYADGTALEADLATSMYIDAFALTNDIRTKLRRIVDEAFSKEQVERLNERLPIRIELNISSSSGKVTDVYFNYISLSGYTNIPIETYRDMELRFKEEISFTLTKLGRKLNYCLLSWSQHPKGREEGTLTINSGALTLPTTNGMSGRTETTPE